MTLLNEDLEQRNILASHFDITDQAVKKASSFIDLDFLSKLQNELLRETIVRCLLCSKERNCCNEVAVITTETRLGTEYGSKHGVNFAGNLNITSILNHKNNETIIMCHNHPSTQSFSLQDISFFYKHRTIDLFVVVSNLGEVELLYRDFSDMNKLQREDNLFDSLNDLRFKLRHDFNDISKMYKVSKEAVKLYKNLGYYRRL